HAEDHGEAEAEQRVERAVDQSHQKLRVKGLHRSIFRKLVALWRLRFAGGEDGACHSGMVRKHQTRNLEIPGSLSRPGMTATRSLLYQRAGAFRKRTEGLVGRRGADQLVIVPRPLGFFGLLDLEQIGRVKLATVGA